MEKKVSKEWMVDMLWGKLAESNVHNTDRHVDVSFNYSLLRNKFQCANVNFILVYMVSWGDPQHPPILLVHGYMDSASTFVPLLELLPNNYYYVGIDLPGHGRSDPYPDGPLISHVHLVEVIRRFVEHMQWDNFIFMSHSMAFIIGCFYNNIFPGKISRFINLDPFPPLAVHYLNYFPGEWYKYIYKDYYGNYARWTAEKSKVTTLEHAINIISMKRQIDEDQAAIVLSRSIIPLENDKVKLSWDPKMKKISTAPILSDILYEVISKNMPPVLNIISTEQNTFEAGNKYANKLLNKCQENVSNYKILYVEGGHDAHITNPDKIAEYVKTFLNTNFDGVKFNVKAKL